MDSYEYIHTPLIYNSAMDASLQEAVVSAARGAWRATGLRGYARIEVRVNAAGVPCVIDVNPNPALNPGVAVYRAAEEAGWTWEQFVKCQLEWAF
jgi:D-alanine-D-alanine ligase